VRAVFFVARAPRLHRADDGLKAVPRLGESFVSYADMTPAVLDEEETGIHVRERISYTSICFFVVSKSRKATPSREMTPHRPVRLIS